MEQPLGRIAIEASSKYLSNNYQCRWSYQIKHIGIVLKKIIKNIINILNKLTREKNILENYKIIFIKEMILIS